MVQYIDQQSWKPNFHFTTIGIDKIEDVFTTTSEEDHVTNLTCANSNYSGKFSPRIPSEPRATKASILLPSARFFLLETVRFDLSILENSKPINISQYSPNVDEMDITSCPPQMTAYDQGLGAFLGGYGGYHGTTRYLTY